MTTTTTTADGGADDRRKADRRKRSLAYDGQDRRETERRAVRDRRANPR